MKKKLFPWPNLRRNLLGFSLLYFQPKSDALPILSDLDHMQIVNCNKLYKVV